jgi:hypothetical protein
MRIDRPELKIEASSYQSIPIGNGTSPVARDREIAAKRLEVVSYSHGSTLTPRIDLLMSRRAEVNAMPE